MPPGSLAGAWRHRYVATWRWPFPPEHPLYQDSVGDRACSRCTPCRMIVGLTMIALTTGSYQQPFLTCCRHSHASGCHFQAVASSPAAKAPPCRHRARTPTDILDALDFSGTDRADLAIVAAADGEVIDLQSGSADLVPGDPCGSWGNWVKVLHPGGHWSFYAHLAAAAVAIGQPVVSRQELGRMGSTGLAGHPHLHFSLFHGPCPARAIFVDSPTLPIRELVAIDLTTRSGVRSFCGAQIIGGADGHDYGSENVPHQSVRCGEEVHALLGRLRARHPIRVDPR